MKIQSRAYQATQKVLVICYKVSLRKINFLLTFFGCSVTDDRDDL